MTTRLHSTDPPPQEIRAGLYVRAHSMALVDRHYGGEKRVRAVVSILLPYLM